MRKNTLFAPFLLCIVAIGFFIGGLSACRHDDDISDLPEICFETDILPIFQNSCAVSGCHDGTVEMNLTTYSNIIEHIEPGDASKSKLYTVMTNTWSPEMMPPDRPVSLQNRTKIKLWIEQGALETTCP